MSYPGAPVSQSGSLKKSSDLWILSPVSFIYGHTGTMAA